MSILDQFDEEAIPVLLSSELGGSLQLAVYRRATTCITEGVDLVPEPLENGASRIFVRLVGLVERPWVQGNVLGSM